MDRSETDIKPLVITMGCPVGVGPELILKLFVRGQKDAVVIGDATTLTWCAKQTGLAAPLISWQPGDVITPGTIPLYTPPDAALDRDDLHWGQPSKKTGRAMGRYIEEAVALIQRGQASALVTCPITKSALNKGGYHFPGHTEMLAKLCAAKRFAMMMAGTSLRVTLVTIHTPLASVSSLVTTKAVAEMIDITWQALHHDFAIAAPRLAVAGLNPHAGEDAMFGSEENERISPAIEAARASGKDVQGPFPPDTVFHKATTGHFDAVVCMYHDQGLIPFKLLHFSDGVNVTLGLPIVRTSVDHGTAYDIAGKGIANPASLVAATVMARKIHKNRTIKGVL